MKVVITALAASLLSCSGALAADLDYQPSPMPYFSWAGGYLGAHAGYGSASNAWTLLDNAGAGACNLCGTEVADFDSDSFLGGVQAGYNFQNGHFVYGLEIGISFLGADDDGTWIAQAAPSANRSVTSEMNWLATLGPRLGYAYDKTLFFAEGGLAIVGEEFGHRNLDNGNNFETDEIDVGVFVGAGIEHAFMDDWSVSAEYNLAHFGEDKVNLDQTNAGGSGTAVFDVDRTVHLFKVGLNYHF